MLQLISVTWGILALLADFVAFFPCLGWLNWLILPFALAGLVMSLIARDQEARGGRTPSNTAVILNGAAVVIGVVRLTIGGGIF
jgi:hypothetical protein